MKENLPYVVVIDIDHMNGIQTARIFKERDIKVVGIARDLDHYCAKTRVCEKIIKSNTKTDQLIDTLVSLGEDFEQKPLLIPSQDTSVLLVSRNREKLEAFYHIALPSKETVEMLMDKPAFFEYATKNNLPIAKYFLIKTRADAENFYGIHSERPFFKDLVEYMISGPIVAMVLEGENAVAKNRELMGATNPKEAAAGTIRADFAESIDANAVHGSDSLENAGIEISYFFGGNELNI